MEEGLFQSSIAIRIAVHKAQDELFKEMKDSNLFLDGNEVNKFFKLYNQYRAIVCDKK